jgi:hypothetical protein
MTVGQFSQTRLARIISGNERLLQKNRIGRSPGASANRPEAWTIARFDVFAAVTESAYFAADGLRICRAAPGLFCRFGKAQAAPVLPHLRDRTAIILRTGDPSRAFEACKFM